MLALLNKVVGTILAFVLWSYEIIGGSSKLSIINENWSSLALSGLVHIMEVICKKVCAANLIRLPLVGAGKRTTKILRINHTDGLLGNLFKS